MIQRKKTKVVSIGNVQIGGGNPISIQSMTNTKTTDVSKTLCQIRALACAGCDIVRVAVPDVAAADAFKAIVSKASVPLVADIHFDWRLAVSAIKNGAAAVRLNPGNIGSRKNVKRVVEAAHQKNIPIRIGVNSGSIPKKMIAKYGHTSKAIVESALWHIKILESVGYKQIKVSVKSSSVPMTLDAYRMLSQRCDYPLHLGITEAGSAFSGSIKSAVGIGTLLAEGIGDTVRVSLADDPIKEVEVAKKILQALGLRGGLDIIACPSCGRTEFDIKTITKDVETALEPYSDINMRVAVMGCVVNGPMEAQGADYAICAMPKEGFVYKKGKIVAKTQQDKIVQVLLNQIESDIKGGEYAG